MSEFTTQEIVCAARGIAGPMFRIWCSDMQLYAQHVSCEHKSVSMPIDQRLSHDTMDTLWREFGAMLDMAAPTVEPER